MKLDAKQQAIVNSNAPFKVCICGPGTGKTAVLVECLAAECIKHPGQTVAICFTNAAAIEFKDRLREVGINQSNWMGFIGTIHAFCLKLCVEYREYVGLPANITVISEEQRDRLIETVMRDLGVKMPMKTIKYCFNDPIPSSNAELIVRELRNRMHLGGLVDFDRLLSYGRAIASLLHAESKWEYKFMAVDEAQDLSPKEAAFIDACQCEKLVVGDPDQSIFSFKSGNPFWLINLANGAGGASIASKRPINEGRADVNVNV